MLSKITFLLIYLIAFNDSLENGQDPPSINNIYF